MSPAGMFETKPHARGASDGPYRAHRTLLSPARVRELSVLRPWRTLGDTAWCWALIVAAWACVAWRPEWWVVTLAVPLIGTRYYGLFILGHDGMHRRIFQSGPRSELFTDLFLIGPIGMVCRVNARNHLDHHQHLASDDDPDLHKHACFNKASRFEYVLFLTGLASVVAVLRNLFVRPLQGREKAEESRTVRYTPRDLAIIFGWQIGLMAGLTAAIGAARLGWTNISISSVLRAGWWAYPVLWILPVYLFAYLPNLIRSFVEHSHPENDDAADEHRLITFTSNPVERLVLSPMNMNFHITHHLWPSIPYYNLPRADAEVRAAAEARGTRDLTWRRSYVGYLWRYFVSLPLAECANDRRRAGSA